MFGRLQHLRAITSAVALGLILGLLATPLAIAHLGFVDADACDIFPASGLDPGRFTEGQVYDAHQHCFTCHWLRSLRSGEVTWEVVCLGIASLAEAVSDLRSGAEHQVAIRFGARAPPA
jgi:hypothetical protein